MASYLYFQLLSWQHGIEVIANCAEKMVHIEERSLSNDTNHSSLRMRMPHPQQTKEQRTNHDQSFRKELPNMVEEKIVQGTVPTKVLHVPRKSEDMVRMYDVIPPSSSTLLYQPFVFKDNVIKLVDKSKDLHGPTHFICRLVVRNHPWLVTPPSSFHASSKLLSTKRRQRFSSFNLSVSCNRIDSRTILHHLSGQEVKQL